MLLRVPLRLYMLTADPFRSRDAWQLNERRVVLSLLHVALALSATVQHVTQDRSQVVFDDESSVRLICRGVRDRLRAPG